MPLCHLWILMVPSQCAGNNFQMVWDVPPIFLGATRKDQAHSQSSRPIISSHRCLECLSSVPYKYYYLLNILKREKDSEALVNKFIISPTFWPGNANSLENPQGTWNGFKNHSFSILFLPHGAIIFLTAVGQRHPRLKMTHFPDYCIQVCVNQVRRPQMKALRHPAGQDQWVPKREPRMAQVSTQACHRMSWGTWGCLGPCQKND